MSQALSVAKTLGETMHAWARDIFPICRSITGPGVRETLNYLSQLLPGLTIHNVPSGTQAFDWTVPDEWTIREAWIEDPAGNRIVDFRNNNLHVVGYSEPVHLLLTLDELQEHLHSIPDQPNAIPYVTSYYQGRWGFCLTHKQREKLPSGHYKVVIDSCIAPGVLNYGELIIESDSDQEIFLSTYICHPSMANNEISGPVVVAALSKWLASLPRRRFTYRIVFIPETIGSLVYLSKHLDHLKRYVVAGFNVTCVGDERAYSYLPSRAGNTLSDKVAVHVLKHIDPNFKRYTWLDRGSDERQYCAPGIDLPIASIMRSKYGEYSEYHTSLDDLTFISPQGLEGGFEAIRTAIEVLEANCKPKATVLGEPQLGKRGLYPTLSLKSPSLDVRILMDLLTYADGEHDLIEIAEILGIHIKELNPIVNNLVEYGLLKI